MRLVLLAVAAAVLALPAGVRAQQVVRGPYLQQGTDGSVIVVWRTDVDTDSRVLFGAAPGALAGEVSDWTAVSQHEVRITGLSPATRYYYAVGTTSQVLAGDDDLHHFTTAPARGSATPFRAWVVGDSGTGNSNQANVRDAMLSFTPARPPDIFLHMGDMAYSDGTDTEFGTKFFAPYESILRTTVCWPTMGNHEGHTSSSPTESGPYYDAYVLPRAAEAGGLASGTEAYYSYDHANVHFVVLDSYDSPREVDGAMLTWLAQDLAATDQEWIVAYWHHPPYSKGSHDSDSEGALVDMRENALPILEAAGVDLVLAGHSHIYERSWLIDGAYETPSVAVGKIVDPGSGALEGDGAYRKANGLVGREGAVYIVAGHGGASVRQEGIHPLIYFAEADHGSCLLDFDRNVVRLLNLRHDGAITDRFTLVKGAALVLASPVGGEQLRPGQTLDIRWTVVGATSARVRIDYSLDDGGSWGSVSADTANTGSYSWTVPSATTRQGLVRVTALDDATLWDQNDAPFSIDPEVTATYVRFGDVWRYHDADVDPGASWTMPAFDDSGWAEGPGELGYGDGDEATLLLDADPNVPSVYFRRSVQVDGTVVAADLRVLHDDGVGVWVNGTRVFEEYLADGTDHATYASTGSSNNEISTATLDPSVFDSGENVVAAMVKQSNATSSDVSFDLELVLTVSSGGGGTDGGVTADGGALADGGSPPGDGGSPTADSGTPRVDGGSPPDGGVSPGADGGPTVDAGFQSGEVTSSCGCGPAGDGTWLGVLLLAAAALRRRGTRR